MLSPCVACSGVTTAPAYPAMHGAREVWGALCNGSRDRLTSYTITCIIQGHIGGVVQR